jgi:tetratricopeptide (TPR) repeat protein
MLLALSLLPFLLAAGQEVVQPPASELRIAFDNLKAAEEQKDIDLVKKLAIETSDLARKVIKSPEPTEEVEAWKARVEYAKEVEKYADYALYVAALRAPSRAKMIELFEALDKQSPSSEYVPQLYGAYVAALTATGAANKAFEYAGKAIAKDSSNEDLLAVLADGALARKQFDRAATYGTKLANVLAGHPRPEGVPTGDWERRRAMLSGRGHWIAGVAYASLNRFAQADKSFRAALPFIKGDNALMAPALFYLGVANYNLARATQDKLLLRQALNFSEEAQNMGGQYGQLAAQNVYAIKQELSRWR